jgi:putative tryptophan/tyrosine transport system substrate-binding protein
VKRRPLLIALGVWASAPRVSFAQQKLYRIGILHSESRDSAHGRVSAFMQGLHELGYQERKNIEVIARYADEDLPKLAAMAGDLVARQPHVILAPNTYCVRAAQRLTDSIPIVFTNAGDPVGSGFALTLARPAKNITGTSHINPDLGAKRLQTLREAFPSISRVAVVLPELAQSAHEWRPLQAAAKLLAFELLPFDIRNRNELDEKITQLRTWRADALYLVSHPATTPKRSLLVDLALALRVPSIAGLREFAEAGALMSYGPNFRLLYRRAAVYVDKILRGAKPGELPIELPTSLELVVNNATARKLAIDIPDAVLLRADEVIK